MTEYLEYIKNRDNMEEVCSAWTEDEAMEKKEAADDGAGTRAA